MSSDGSAKPRLVIIGLDGITFRLIGPWMDQGLLPNLSAMKAEGASGELTSCFLPLSPPAWTTITTGKEPGGHGIFGFTILKEGTYDADTVDSTRVRRPCLWDYLNRHGMTTGVFNVPITWPPRKVDGYMAGGFLTPDVHGHFTYPEELGKQLHEVAPGGYRTWTSQVFSTTCAMPYLQELKQLVEMRTEVAEHLLATRPCDFGMFVFMESDWLQHKLWHVLEDPSQKDTELYRAGLAVYQALDAAVGRIREAVGPECNVVAISDHGAGLHTRTMHINKWLYENGFMALKNTFRLRVKRFLERRRFLLRAYAMMSKLRGRFNWIGRLIPTSLATRAIGFFNSYDDVDWSGTRAYGRDALGQIYVNLKGREPEGIVEEGPEYDALLTELEQALAKLPDPETGKPVVTGMKRGRDIYRGQFSGEVPDLLFILDDFKCNSSVRFGFDTDGYFSGMEFQDSGSHRPDGILLASGPAIRPGVGLEGARIADITPTVLHLMGAPLVEDLDGKPLEAMMTDAFKADHPVSYEQAGRAESTAKSQKDVSDQQVKDKLKALGYL